MKIGPRPELELRAQRTPLLPWLMVLFAGTAALGLLFLIRPALGSGAYHGPIPHRYTYAFNRQLLLLFVPYALVLVAWWRGTRVPLWVLFGGAAVLHLLVMVAPPPQSQDFYQYLFYGKMQSVHGANPYVVQPAFFYRDAWYSWIKWPDQTSVYGPVWTLISAGAVKLGGSSLTSAFIALKSAVLALDLAIMWMIVSIARTRPDPETVAGWGLLVYAWNPLIWVSVPLGGLADVAIAASFVGAVLARRRGRSWVATLLLTAALLVKVYAAIGLVLHLVLMARERGKPFALRQTALAGLTATLIYAPYWAGLDTFRGLIRVADFTNQSLVGGIQALLTPVMGALGSGAPADTAAVVIRWILAALLLGAVGWAIRGVRSEKQLWRATVGVLAVYAYLTPWFFYWYIVAPLALVAVLPRDRWTVPLLTFSGTVFISTWFLPTIFGEPLQTLLRYGPPAFLFIRGVGRDAGEGRSAGSVKVPARSGTRVRATVPAAK